MASKVWRAKFKNKRNASEKVCIYCGIKLEAGKNAYKDVFKTRSYVCKKCEQKRKKQYARERGRYRVVTYKGKKFFMEPEKIGRKDYCEICERSLLKKRSILHHLAYDDNDPTRYLITVCYNCHALVHFAYDKGLQKKFKDMEHWSKKYVEIREVIFQRERIAGAFGTKVNRNKAI